jgi:hypothetical protein
VSLFSHPANVRKIGRVNHNAIFEGAMEKKFITPLQYAREMGVSQKHVWRWIDDGSVLAINIARDSEGLPYWRIPVEEAERFRRSRMSKGATADAT